MRNFYNKGGINENYSNRPYSYVACPHRVWRDTFDDQSLKDPPNEFVQLLWEKGVRHEKEVIEKQKADIEL